MTPPGAGPGIGSAFHGRDGGGWLRPADARVSAARPTTATAHAKAALRHGRTNAAVVPTPSMTTPATDVPNEKPSASPELVHVSPSVSEAVGTSRSVSEKTEIKAGAIVMPETNVVIARTGTEPTRGATASARASSPVSAITWRGRLIRQCRDPEDEPAEERAGGPQAEHQAGGGGLAGLLGEGDRRDLVGAEDPTDAESGHHHDHHAGLSQRTAAWLPGRGVTTLPSS